MDDDKPKAAEEPKPERRIPAGFVDRTREHIGKGFAFIGVKRPEPEEGKDK